MEKIARFLGAKKLLKSIESLHVSGCHGFSVLKRENQLRCTKIARCASLPLALQRCDALSIGNFGVGLKALKDLSSTVYEVSGLRVLHSRVKGPNRLTQDFL